MIEPLRKAGRWFLREVAPIPGRLALDAVYFLLIVPYGLAWKRLRTGRISGSPGWRPVERLSNDLEKARRRF